MNQPRSAALLAACLALAGCPAAPTLQPEPPAAAPGITTLATHFDVDPVRAQAFERADLEGQAPPLVVNIPEVHHDPGTGRTTVQLVATGQAGELGLEVQAERPLVTTAPATVRAGDTLTLGFDNPEATSFALDLKLSGKVEPAANRRVLAIGGVTATASSTLSGFAAARAVDGNINTQWTNATWQEKDVSLTLDLGSVRNVASAALKLRPFSGGATYRIEASSNGSAYTPVTGALKPTSWNLETKALGTQARYLRLHFTNDTAAPEARFEVYEAKVEEGAGSAPTPTPTPTPTTMPPPTTGGSVNETFESYALGADPSNFVDPLNEGYSYSWMPRVRWRVATQGGSKQFLHDGLNSRAVLSFRRYRTALTPRYFGQVSVTPIQSNTYSPTGDQGTQFYYIDPTHYVELLIKPTMFELWVCNNGQPFTSAGWQRLWFANATTKSGQKRILGAEIDTNAHTLKAYYDGSLRTTQTISIITNRSHWLALRGTGNVVAHDDLRITPR